MGLFGSDSFLGSLLGGTKESKISNVPQGSLSKQWQDVFLANYLFPQLFEYLDAASLTGEGGMLSAVTKSGKDMPTSFEDIDFTKLTAALPGMKAKAAEVNAANFQKTYETMGKIPALADMFAKAGGNVDATGDLAKIFGSLSGAALGTAASSGFLTDPLKQMNTLGPLALQKYQIEQSIQQGAQAQALGLAGAGGLPASGLFGMNAAGPSQWVPGVLNAAGLFGGPNLSAAYNAASLNTQLGQQMSTFNSGLLPPIFSSEGDAKGVGAGIGAFLGGCWVADELYGVGSDMALYARLYANTHDSPFLRVYMRHGKGWAAWLKERPWAKPLMAPIWDEMARRGAAMLRRKAA